MPGGLSILYSGPFAGTSLQRARALAELGHDVVHVPSGIPRMTTLRYQLYRVANRIRARPDVFGTNRALRRQARRRPADVVWIDKGLSVQPSTLRALRALCPEARLVAYSPDDMMNPSNQSPAWLEGVPLYDVHVTTKSYNVAELEGLGARRVLFVDNAYDPATHRPLELSTAESERLGADVGFVGQFEQERAEWLRRLAEAGLRVTVRGPTWSRYPDRHANLEVVDGWVGSADYAKVVNATKINLGFLRRENRDLQTTRSVEIPACGSFLLAERTEEHLRLFREGEEAEFFASFDELLEKCRYYLDHEDERLRIAAAGLRRCREGGYGNPARLEWVLDQLFAGDSEREPQGQTG
ncbi:MAG: glycosyltransferase [Myxococcota bacterium]|nr:glycosyltransferase [Myxococcota bacterium]